MDESREPQEFFAAEYAPMSEKELTKLSCEYDDLVESAQAALRDELKKRGMEMPKPRPIIPAPSLPTPSLYGTKSNHQLLGIARGYDTLPEANQVALREEFASRGLEPPLVDDDEPENPDKQTNEIKGPVVVGTYANPVEGSLARAVLQQAGIECFLYDENMYDVKGYSATLPAASLLGGLRLVVASFDAENAKALLSQAGDGKGAPLR